jgi:hypothetical protein
MNESKNPQEIELGDIAHSSKVLKSQNKTNSKKDTRLRLF